MGHRRIDPRSQKRDLGHPAFFNAACYGGAGIFLPKTDHYGLRAYLKGNA